MKKILIVGGTGFLGFHFAKYCLKRNFKVISVSRGKPKKIRKLNNVNYVFLDISKKKALEKKLKKFLNINYVINFGGEVEHKKKKKTFSSHFKGLKNLISFYTKGSLNKFVQIGSGLEYGNARSPHKETFPIKPNSNYASAKGKATSHIFKIKKKCFPTIVIRPYQVYGPNQDCNRLIPIVVTNCLQNQSFPCSSGKQFRDFLYIDDFVKIVFKLMTDKRKNNEIFNVGYGKATNIKKVINLIKMKIRKGSPEFGKIPLRKEENLITFPSINKLKKQFKWKPKVNLSLGLKKTISYYANGSK